MPQKLLFSFLLILTGAIAGCGGGGAEVGNEDWEMEADAEAEAQKAAAAYENAGREGAGGSAEANK